MEFIKGKPKIEKRLSLTLLVIGAILCLTPSVNAAPTTIANRTFPRQIESQASLASAPNHCLRNISEGFSVETRHYYAGICYTRNGPYYVGHSKKGNGSIFLRVFSPRRNVYIARNGQYGYILDMNQRLLTIKLPNGRQITERVIRVFDS